MHKAYVVHVKRSENAITIRSRQLKLSGISDASSSYKTSEYQVREIIHTVSHDKAEAYHPGKTS